MNTVIDGDLFDVIVVGTGIAGAVVAKQLGLAGRRVLLIEAGEAIPHGRAAHLERFYLDTHKYPEAPYPVNPNAQSATVADLIEKDASPSYLDQSPRDNYTSFGSTYERRAGGTMWHWMGTCLRLLPSDFHLKTLYGRGVDWPIEYDDLGLKVRSDGLSYYDRAEREIGVSANKADQWYNAAAAPFRADYQFPNPGIPLSRVDQFFRDGVQGMTFEGYPVSVIPTPAGRNSRPYDGRRVCAGNTNCVPICPIEAKYDPTVTLHKAFNTGNVSALFQHVATKLILDEAKRRVTGVEYISYSDATKVSPSGRGIARAKQYVVAAHGIETPKLLLLSGCKNRNIGLNLMDHPFYLKWGLAPRPVFPYRGPLSTAGLDGLRDGQFRRDRSAFRIEIGNDGWNLGASDPTSTLLDFIEGNNKSKTNESRESLFGGNLVTRLNDIYTRQCRIGFELEQIPSETNRVTLSNSKDALGIPRPKITYSLSDYEKRALGAADRLTSALFAKLGIADKTSYELVMGAGHIIGTYRMGNDASTSVVTKEQRSHEFDNLYLLGSGVFPTSGTGNPSLTIAALAFWAADTIHDELR